MEGRKPVDSFSASSSPSSSSSSSSSSNLFGGKESSLVGMSAGTSSSSTTGIFSSMFPPPSTILGRNSLHSDALGSLRKDSQFQIGNAKHALADGLDKRGDIIERNVINKETSMAYSDQAAEPFSLSSSLYYGGRDHCTHSSNAEVPETPDTHHKYEENGEEDDLNCSNIASRGNWWQGSLYY